MGDMARHLNSFCFHLAETIQKQEKSVHFKPKLGSSVPALRALGDGLVELEPPLCAPQLY